MRIFLLLLAAVLLVPNFVESSFRTDQSKKYDWEEFSPQIASSLTSIEATQQYIDSIAIALNAPKQSLPYVNIMAATIRKRFYHGYSYYNCKQNWLAVVIGKLIWDDVAAIVLPDDILQYPMAACSQQELVFIELLRNNNIHYRKVIFKHHFALEAMVNGNWYYFDTNLEPTFTNNKRESLSTIISQHQLNSLYEGRMTEGEIAENLGQPTYGAMDEFPAKNAKIFQLITKFLSHWLWLLFLIGFIKMQYFSGKTT